MNQELLPFIQSLGLTYSAEFIPASRAPERDSKTPGLNWKVTIQRGRVSLSTPYWQGIAHVPGYKQSLFGSVTLAQKEERDALIKSCETGKAGGRWLPSLATRTGETPIPAPSIDSVLYCLVSDGSALDYPTFEEWASNFGYDEDSRKGESIYRQCVTIGLQLRAMLGDANLAKLNELFQDY